MKKYHLGIALSFLICFLACKSDKPIIEEEFDLTIHINRDPGRINPILSTTSRAREIYQNVFLNLADIDPVSLELSPVLAKSLPERETAEDGRTQYTFDILDEAVWENGQAITAADFEFTLKVVFHPNVKTPNWKSQLDIIDEVILYPEDEKKITFVLKEEYLNVFETLCSYEVYPRHIYDPNNVLAQVELSVIRDENAIASLMEQDTVLRNFGNVFSSTQYSRESVEGAGAYLIDSWESEQYIQLRKKENWWGNQFKDRTLLQAQPNKLLFQIIADETTALTQFKAGNIDIMNITDATAFSNLESEEGASSKFDFHKPKVTQYFYLAMNNDDARLKNLEVRQAFARCVDIENLIDIMEGGDAVRALSPVSPFASYYNKSLSPVPYDIVEANQILETNGWIDSDNNGIRDKILDGRKYELDFRMFASSDKSEKLAILVKENARKAGIQISIIRKKLSTIFSDHLYKNDFEFFPTASLWSLIPYDPYSRFHSDNATSGGYNFCSYRSDEADELINTIRTTKSESERTQAYLDFQKIFYQDQPIVVLYSPVSRFATSKKVDPLITVKKPGYFAMAFKKNPITAFSEN